MEDDEQPVNEHKIYAELSRAAYHPKDASLIPQGYAVDDSLSNRNRTVYYHKESKKAVVAFRGTDPKNLKDLANDALIAAGAEGLSSRFRNSAKVTRAAQKKYGKDNVHVTGHSLGGSQALFVNKRLDVPATAFNPGKGFTNVKKDAQGSLFKSVFPILKRKQRNKATIVTTGVDPLSVAAVFGLDKKVLVAPKLKNVHSIENFT